MSELKWPVKTSLKMLFTLVVVAVALWLAVVLWRAYVLAPWTRDGRVSVQVVRIAPEVSGTVTAVPVADNQFVARGAPLFQLDPARFQLAVSQAEAQLAQANVTLTQKRDEAQRRQSMAALMAKEELQRAQQAALIAQAEQQEASVALAVARLDLQRATLRAPVDGYVTHLRLQQGDFAVAGTPAMALVNAHSFWITGYFEETKLQAIRPGSRATIHLMGDARTLRGHVVSIGRGITDANELVDAQGLPSVEPTFSWIRLAQRIPVRIALDALPPDVVLAAGMTCSITVDSAQFDQQPQGRLTALLARWL